MLDFYLWGWAKSVIYRELPQDLDELKLRIQGALESVTPEVLQRVRLCWVRRAVACIRADGAHFEHHM